MATGKLSIPAAMLLLWTGGWGASMMTQETEKPIERIAVSELKKKLESCQKLLLIDVREDGLPSRPPPPQRALPESETFEPPPLS